VKSILDQAQDLLNGAKPQPDSVIRLLKPLMAGGKATWPVYHIMGTAMFMKDQFARAEEFMAEALRRGGDLSETWLTLAVAQFRLNRFDESLENVRQALSRDPNYFKAVMHLAAVLHAQGQLNEALAVYQKANSLDPRNARIAHQIGVIYRDQGILDKALELLGIATQMDPTLIQADFDRAALLTKMMQYEQAGVLIEDMMARRPDMAEIRVLKAELFKEQDLYDEAVVQYEVLLKEYPQASAARVNYGLCLQELARYDESEQQYLLALRYSPMMKEALSNYLMVMHYNPKRTREHIFKAHARWDELFAPKERPVRPVPANRDPQRRLRVGLISGGFRGHPVGWMITTALENLDKSQFEIYCYTTNNLTDDITRRIIKVCDAWKSVLGYSDDIIAEMIRHDEIDILVELSGHASDNRLQTIALEPAPIQVKWVGGLFNTSGLRSMDYLITDWHETPAGDEPFYTEKLVRMPGDYISFLPPEYAPEVGELPALQNGYVTFGCFNNPSKINPELLDQWAEILKAVPGSRLILKSRQYSSEQFKVRLRGWMAERGISAERLLFEGRAPHKDLLDAYNRVDIALDPWPYSGGLSTCEALWMGVPVVTLPGPTFAGRHSATHLANAGYPGLVARNWEAYVGIAVSLASDLRKLAAMRVEMREQVRTSALCDAPAFGRDLGVAFRAMWQQYTAGVVNDDSRMRDHIDVRSQVKTYPPSVSVLSEKNIPGAIQTGENVAIDMNDSSGASSPTYAENTTQADPGLAFAKSADADVNKIAAFAWRRGQRDNLLVRGKHDIIYSVPDSLEVMTTYVMLEQGQWFDSEVGFVQDYLQAGMKMLDVGAGFGAYALGAAVKVGPHGSVYAFEPVEIMRKHLDISKVENGLTNLSVSGRALGSSSGKMGLQAGKTPELSTLIEEGDSIQVTTLDSWWDFEGNPALGVVKIDVNGKELDVLSGAERLLTNTSPILVLAANGADPDLEALSTHLATLGYTSFDFISGLGLLSPIEDWSQRDAYTQNIVAVKTERVNELLEQGWIHDEKVDVSEPEVGLWEKTLEALPWSESLMPDWKKNALESEHANYYRALDYICAAENLSGAEKGKSRKATLMLLAAEELISIYNSGTPNVSVAYTLTRLLNTLGKRGNAVAIMHKLMNETQMGQQNLVLRIPFLLPISSMDFAPIRTEFSKWLMVRTIESWLHLTELTGHVSNNVKINFRTALENNPEHFNTYSHSCVEMNKYFVEMKKMIHEQKPKHVDNHNLPGKLIVSLTSYPARFENLPLTLLSLTNQTVKPDNIILWISETDKNKLTGEILSFSTQGVQIKFCADYKSYKKIIPTLILYPNDFIVTADDDLFYRSDWLEGLVKSYEGNNCVVAHRGHKITFSSTQNVKPYKDWLWEHRSSKPSHLLFPTSGAGTLYPPGIFHADILNSELFRTLTPNADDIWLYWMVRLRAGVFKSTSNPHPLIEWKQKNEKTLWKNNILKGENDIQFKNVLNRYKSFFDSDLNFKPSEHYKFNVQYEDYNYYLSLPNYDSDHIQKIISHTHRPYEHEMLNDMKKHLNNGDVFFDVGANVGNHSIFLSISTNCEVVSFEPNNNLVKALNKSIIFNKLQKKITLINKGVGAASGFAKFEKEIRDNIGQQKLILVDNESGIELVTLDSFLEKNTKVIKIDVEGMELDVLMGAKKLLKKQKPLLYIEAATKSEFDMVNRFLEEYGYKYSKTFNATPTHLFV
jgi:FkbM family methyltransferase